MMTYLANMQTDKIFQFMGIKAFLVRPRTSSRSSTKRVPALARC
jgi:hypothetical protein